jgi:hypothetical protein
MYRWLGGFFESVDRETSSLVVDGLGDVVERYARCIAGC